MALIVSAASGNFNAGATWVGGIVPGAADEARASTGHTVTITANVTCTELSNAGTGLFILNSGVTLTANVTHKSATVNVNCLHFTAAAPATASIVGNITGASVASTTVFGAVRNVSTGTLNVTGSVTGGSGNTAVGTTNFSTGTLNVTGNVTGGTTTNCVGVFSQGNGTVTIVGNITGGSGATAYALELSVGTVTITGSVQGGSAATAAGVINSGAGSVNITGNITASTGANGFIAAGGTNRLSVNAINALNGIAAIYAASYLVSPVPYNGYIRYANNGTNYLNQFTTDSLSAFSMPPISAVRSGVQFANNTLTGTCQIPAAASVSFGVPVDTTVGTAALNPVDFMNVSVASLTATDSLGARLKNSATVESVGRIIASFSN